MSKNNELRVVIAPDGKVRFIYDDRLAELCKEGRSETKRASHVEPCSEGWTADLSPVQGPVLGPFHLREQALQAEVKWLKENVL